MAIPSSSTPMSWDSSSATVGRRLRRRGLVDRLAHGHAVQPRVELGGIARGALQGDDRHLLRDVLRGGRITEHAERRRAGERERAGRQFGARVDAWDRERGGDQGWGVGSSMLHRRHRTHRMWQRMTQVIRWG